MHFEEFNDKYARSLICVLGRESTFGSQRSDLPLIENESNPSEQITKTFDLENEIFFENMVSDIFIFEIDRHHILGNARSKARQFLEKRLNIRQKDNDDLNEQNKIYFEDEDIQQSLDECEQLEHSYADMSTSPMGSVYDKTQLLNVSITLHKRIRILGGVQNIFGYPSLLVVMNNRGAFVFLVGPRLNDQEISSVSKVQSKAIPSKPIEPLIRNLPLLSGSDIASAAGIYLKHCEKDLVQTAARFSQRTKIVAQTYAPSLVIDASPLGFNQFGIISDFNALIYVLLPNPLFKRVKQQNKIKNTDKVFDNDGYQYLPMCAVLNAKIALPRHYQFIVRCDPGTNSIFEGLSQGFFNKMYKYIDLLDSQQSQTSTQLEDLKQQKLNENNSEFDKQDEKQRNIENINEQQNENEDNSLHAEDLESDYYLHMKQQNPQFRRILDVSPKGSLQNFPSIPPFAIFSKTGAILRCQPSNYDVIPIKDIFITLHIHLLQDLQFGHIWKDTQNELVQDFQHVEDQAFRMSVIERSLTEYITTGKISRNQHFMVSDFLPTIYGARDGRFIESKSIFGSSPHPITAHHS
ncbi:MAG: hypothetical protein EZS28_023066 [Streblomastix strix]|uniref:Uncharacterized protein n=1 Tax=Streblomastix strix TaxID=222440 RepID=A0A5J4VGE8_9EUKA|nr:MAG: hypothetical protein EZS28_023066 [Streblomastix strix]